MTDLLEETKRLLAAATPGEFYVCNPHLNEDLLRLKLPGPHGVIVIDMHRADAALIAHARNAMPALVEEVKLLRERLQRAEDRCRRFARELEDAGLCPTKNPHLKFGKATRRPRYQFAGTGVEMSGYSTIWPISKSATSTDHLAHANRRVHRDDQVRIQ